MPTADQLLMKGRYSFEAFGRPKVERSHQDVFKTAFRTTMQTDTPYYRDRVAEPFNVEHALIDPSHTFFDKKISHKRNMF